MAAGGSRDVAARTFATVGEKYLGQPIVVINKPGASGMIRGRAGVQAQGRGKKKRNQERNSLLLEGEEGGFLIGGRHRPGFF